MHQIPLSIATLTVLAVIASGCQDKSGSSYGGAATTPAATSGAASSNAGAGNTTGQASANAATDTTPPVLSVAASTGPATMHQGPAQVTFQGGVQDADSGVASVSVNGVAATITGTDWQAVVTLLAGNNHITVVARDNAGNEIKTSFAVLYGPQLIATTQPVTEATKSRIARGGFVALSSMATAAVRASSAISQAVINSIQTVTIRGIPVPVTVRSFSFTQVDVDLTPSTAGIRSRTTFEQPTMTVDVPLLGSGIVLSADRFEAAATIRLDVVGGQTQTQISAVQVTVTNPSSSNALISALGTSAIIEPIMEAAIRTALPAAINTALRNLITARNYAFGGRSITVDVSPQQFSYDAEGISFLTTANVTATTSNQTTTNPGSISRRLQTNSAPPLKPNPDTHHVYAWASEDVVNRTLHGAWESGLLNVTFDQQFLQQLGINLPINVFDGRVLALFFPNLAGMMPATGPVPAAIRLTHGLPPTAIFDGQPTMFRTAMGEVRLSLALDFGGGYTDLLTLTVFMQSDGDLALRNNQIILRLGQNLLFHFELEQNPLGLSAPDISGFVNSALPYVAQLVNTLVPPIPVPSLPMFLNVQPSNLGFDLDGPGQDYIGIKADL